MQVKKKRRFADLLNTCLACFAVAVGMARSIDLFAIILNVALFSREGFLVGRIGEICLCDIIYGSLWGLLATARSTCKKRTGECDQTIFARTRIHGMTS